MKHIYIFNSVSWASEYGIGTYIQELVGYLQNKQDIRIYIVRLFDDKEEFEIRQCKGYITYCIPNLESELVEDIYYRNAWYILCKYISVSTGDGLIFHLNYHKEHIMVPYMKERFPGCMTLLTIHYMTWCLKLKGNIIQFQKMLVKKDIITPVEAEILNNFNKERLAYFAVDKLICLSFYTKKVLMQIYQLPEIKINVVYNGLKDESVWLNQYEKINLKNELFIPEKDKIILFVGRLNEIKGLGLLINAFKLVIMQMSNVHLVVIGDGDFAYYLNLCRKYWAKVTFTGKLKKSDLYKFYSIADIGIMPSFHEQCSYVAIEMQMFGIPLITSDSTGLREMNPCYPDMIIPTVEYEGGVEMSINVLSNKIIDVLSSKFADKMSKIGYKHFLENYNRPVFANTMNNVYEI